MKNWITIASISLFSFLIIISSAQAKNSVSGLLDRSSETLKFEANKSGSADFVIRKDRFQGAKTKKSEKAEDNSGLSIASKFIEAQNVYKLTISDSTGGGLLISDQSLDQVPAEGYTVTAECLLKLAAKAYDAKKYVYLKTKTDDETIPYQYSRLELDMTIGKAKLIMDINSITNPDGSGNLKYDKNAQRQLIAQRRKELQEAVDNKTAADDQIEEMNELMMLEMQDRREELNRWDFDGNRRRQMQQKRQRQLEADGRIKPKKRTVEQEAEVAPDTK